MRDDAALAAWFAARTPSGWYVERPAVRGDREEIVVIGTIAPPEGDARDDAAVARQVRLHRETSRSERMAIAQEAELCFGKKVSWGVRCAGNEFLFTTYTAPVMTRLRLGERSVLDLLIAAGVARSRSDALAWCVRLVGQHEADWIAQLRQAVADLEQVRDGGPRA